MTVWDTGLKRVLRSGIVATIDDVRRMSGEDQGLGVMSTTRTDGSVHSTVVNAGVMPHPLTGREIVALVIRGNTRKRTLLRRAGRASLVFRSGWEWAGVEGAVDVIGPDDPFEGFHMEDVPQLLRDVFSAAGGTHDDWDEYDRVMREERRAAVLINPERILGSPR